MQEYTVTILSCDNGEWEGIYVDCLLFEEGHELSNKDFIDLINKHKHFTGIEQKYINTDDFEEIGCELPFRLSEIPEGMIK